MTEHHDDTDQRLAELAVRLAELADSLAESMLLQAEFMTWVALNTQLGVPRHAAQAVEFSQRMLDEARSLGDANRAFIEIQKSRIFGGEAT